MRTNPANLNYIIRFTETKVLSSNAPIQEQEPVENLAKEILNTFKKPFVSLDIKKEGTSFQFQLETEEGRVNLTPNAKIRESAQHLFNRIKPPQGKVVHIDFTSGQPTPPFVPPDLQNFNVDDRLLAHIHADEFGSGTALQGGAISRSLTFVRTFFLNLPEERRNAWGLSSELLERLKIAFDLDQEVIREPPDEYEWETKFLNALEIAKSGGQPFFFPGGWINQPGHAQYYEISRDPETDKANFKIFDLGAGASPGTKDEAGKTKSSPVTELKGIEWKKFESQAFCAAVWEMQLHLTLPDENENTNYGIHDFSSLKNFLAPELIVTYPDQVSASLLQRAGFCSWRSLMAYLKTHMPLEEYKRFKFEAKLVSLAASLAQPDHESQLSLLGSWRLKKKSYQKLCRSAEALYREGIIDNHYLQAASTYLMQLGQAIKKDRPEPTISDLSLDQPPQSISPRMPGYERMISISPVESRFSAATRAQRSQMPTEGRSLIDQAKQLNATNPTRLLTESLKLISACNEEWEKGADLDPHLALEQVIANLPFDENYWKDYFQDGQCAEIALEVLSRLFSSYMQTYYTLPEAQIETPWRYFNCLKIFYIQSLATATLTQNEFAFYPLNPELCKQIASEFHNEFKNNFKFYDPEKEQQWLKLLSWTDQCPAKILDLNNRFCEYYNVGISEKLLQIKFAENQESTLLERLKKLFPDLWTNNQATLSQLKPAEQERSMYSHKDLPEWFLRIQNQLHNFIYFSYFSSQPKGQFDRTNGLNLTALPDEELEYDFSTTYSLIFHLEDTLSSSRHNQELFPLSRTAKIQKIAQSIDLNPEQTEADVLREFDQFLETPDKAHKRMAYEEFRALVQAQISGKLYLTTLLDFIFSHQELLNELDYLIQIQKNLFTVEFQDQVSKNPALKKRFIAFLNLFENRMREENHIECLVIALRLKRYFQNYFPEDLTDNISDKLSSLLDVPKLEKRTASLIYAELLATIRNQDTLTFDDLSDILTGWLHVNTFPPDKRFLTRFIEKEMREVACFFAEEIQSYFSKHPNKSLELVENAVQFSFPKLKGTWKRVKDKEFEFILDDGHTRFSPFAGKLHAQAESAHVPERYLSHPLFSKLFPDVTKAASQTDGSISFIIEGDHFQVLLLDQEKLHIERTSEAGQKSIFSLRDNLTYAISGGTKSKIGSRPIVDTHAAYVHEDRQRIDFYKKNTLKYYALTRNSEDNFITSELIRCKDNYRLGRTNLFWKRLEDPDYVHEWYEGDELKEVEFPRFKLKFTVQQTAEGKKLFCKQFPGFYFESKELKSLGSYKNFFNLTNGRERIALFPLQSFAKPDQYEVFEPKYKIDRNLSSIEMKPQSYITTQVLNKDRLDCTTRLGNLFLAEVSLLNQNTKYAHELLMLWGKKLSRFSDKEQAVLHAISNQTRVTHNESGDAAAIQLRASLFLLENFEKFAPPKGTQEEQSAEKQALLNQLKSNYQLYLQHESNVNTALRISKIQEFKIIRYFAPEFSERLNLLKGHTQKVAHSTTQTRVKPLPILQKLVELPQDSSSYFDEQLDLAKDFEALHDHFITLLVTRGLKQLPKLDLIHLFLLAKKLEPASPLREKLLAVLEFEKNRPSTYGLTLGHIRVLEMITKYPADDLPDPPETAFEDRIERKKWFNSLLRYAKKMELTELLAAEPVEEFPLNLPSESLVNTHACLLDPEEFDTLPQLAAPVEWKRSANQFLADNAALFPTPAPKPDPVLKLPPSPRSQLIQRIGNQLSKHLQTFCHKKAAHPSHKLIETETNRIQTDFTTLVTETSKMPKPIEASRIAEIKGEQLNLLEPLAKQKNEVLNQLQILMHQAPQDELAKTRLQLLKQGGLWRPLTLEEVLFSFGKQRPEELLARNPALTVTDIKQLFQYAAQYMLMETEEKNVWRRLSAIQTYENATTPEAQQEANLELAKILLPRPYSITERPGFLTFEYFGNLALRPEQAQLLERYLNEGDLNLVVELIMASGKSYILLPLLGALRANGENISMLVVPQVLFDTLSSQTQETLYTTFGMHLRTLDFERNSYFDLLTLTNIRQELEEIRKNRHCLMMTSRSIQSLILKGIEFAYDYYLIQGKGDPIPSELELFLDIMKTLSKLGLPQLDEVDTLLNILHETCFSTGEQKPLDPIEGKVTTLLYRQLYTNSAFKKLMRLESLPNSQSKAAFSPELYHNTVKEPLIEAFIQRMATFKDERAEQQNEIQNFFKHIPEEDLPLLKGYLSRDKKLFNAAQAYFDKQTPLIQNILSLAGEEICELLPMTLSKNCNENYGLDKRSGGIFAVPFLAANKPKTGSEFANRNVTLNYTMQAYVKEGVPFEALKHELKKLEEDAKREVRGSGNRKSITETAAWAAYKQLSPDTELPLLNLSDGQIEYLRRAINKSIRLRMHFVDRFIFPQMQVYEERISASAHTLVSFFDKVFGFTGTLWNRHSMHRKIHSEPSPGTDAKTIVQLWSNSLTAISTTKEEDISAILKQLHNEGIQTDLIADSGAYFKNQSNLENAQAIYDFYRKPVLFFNPQGVATIWDGIREIPYSESVLKIGEFITFLDQAMTTGTNVLQKEQAIGLITIGPHMLLRDLLQAAWRLRGLEKGQKVHFLISEEVKTLIRQTLGLSEKEALNFEHILLFCLFNQANRQGDDNYRAFQSELNEIQQKITLDTLFNSEISAEQKRGILRQFRAAWFQPTNQEPRHSYGKLAREEASEGILEKAKEGLLEVLKAPALEAYRKEVEQVFERYKDVVPTQVKSRSDVSSATMEQQVQTQNSQQNQLQSEQFYEMDFAAIENKAYRHYMDIEDRDVNHDYSVTQITDELMQLYNIQGREVPAPPHFTLATYLQSQRQLADYQGAFKGIELTLNMTHFHAEEPQAAEVKFFGPDRRIPQYLLVDEAKETVKLISLAEARQRVEFKNLYSLHLGYVNQDRGYAELSPEMQLKILKVRFLAGESFFGEEEMLLLGNWIKKEGVERMRELFLDHVLLGQISARRNYLGGSSLKEFFQKL